MINDFVKKRHSDIYLSDSDIKILEKYRVEYNKYSNMKELLFLLEDILNKEEVEDDLEDLVIKLSEYNYYFKTNK